MKHKVKIPVLCRIGMKIYTVENYKSITYSDFLNNLFRNSWLILVRRYSEAFQGKIPCKNNVMYCKVDNNEKKWKYNVIQCGAKVYAQAIFFYKMKNMHQNALKFYCI